MVSIGDNINFVGTVDTIVFANQDQDGNGYAVFRILLDEEYRQSTDDRLVDNRHRVTVCGENMSHLPSGEKLHISGKVDKNRYGLQVKAETYTIAQPKHLHEIQRFLIANVHLINSVIATRIVNAFGFETLDVISNTPERLKEIEGIGEKRYKEVVECWEQQRYERELLIFFTNVGLPTRFKSAIVTKYGDAAVRLIKEDPYRLARDIKGIGFVIADGVAKRLNIQETSDIRVRAAALHLLDEQRVSGGHCFSYEAELSAETHQFLAHPMLDPDHVTEVIRDAVTLKIIIRQDDRLYHPIMAWAEDFAVERLVELINAPLPFMLQGERLARAQKAAIDSAQFPLDPVQEQAILAALSNKVSVITGGPGTGKTTITKCVVAGLKAAGLEVHLMSPTGRAAKRMTQVIGLPAATIHRELAQIEHLGAAPFDDSEVVDESSMIDVSLLAQQLRYTNDETIVIFVGDVDQLPSVGPGSVLRDLIGSGSINTTRLTKIFRQAEGSDIIVNAHGINHGMLPRINRMNKYTGVPQNTDMILCEIDDAEKQAEAIKWLVTQFGPKRGFDPIKDTQVITPGHSGAVGVKSLNNILQGCLNPQPHTYFEVREGVRWGVGDRVMNTKNTIEYGLSNGDLGTIEEIHFDAKGKPEEMVVNFEGQFVELQSKWFSHIQLAYASTVHKVQGSEFPFLVMALHPSHYMLLQRNLLYTGVTRARQMCVLVANRQALGRALQNIDASLRRTHLATKLRIGVQRANEMRVAA